MESLPVAAALKNTCTCPRFSLFYWFWENSVKLCRVRAMWPWALRQWSEFQKTDLCVRWGSWICCAGDGKVNTHSVKVKSSCRTLKKKMPIGETSVLSMITVCPSQYSIGRARLGNTATVRKHLTPSIPSPGGAGVVWLKADLSRWVSGPAVATCFSESSPSPSGHAGPYTAATCFSRGSCPHPGTSWASCTRCVDHSHLPPLHLPAACMLACLVTLSLSLGSRTISTSKPRVLTPGSFSSSFSLLYFRKVSMYVFLSFPTSFYIQEGFIHQVPFWAPGDRQPGFMAFENSRAGPLLLNLHPLRTHETEHRPVLLSAAPALWWKGLGCFLNPAQSLRASKALSSDSVAIFSLQVRARPLQTRNFQIVKE